MLHRESARQRVRQAGVAVCERFRLEDVARGVRSARRARVPRDREDEHRERRRRPLWRSPAAIAGDDDDRPREAVRSQQQPRADQNAIAAASGLSGSREET